MTLIFFSNFVVAENLSIQANNITIDKNKQKTIFRDNVIFVTKENKTIKGDYAEYDRKNGIIVIKNNIKLIDQNTNQILTDYAEYNENKKIFKSMGPTEVLTAEGYIVNSADIIMDNSKNSIVSNKKTIIKDIDGNKIFLENFEFLNKKNIFKSIGVVKVEDKLNNTFEFSQIYIDTKKKEILGTDLKAFVNDKNFKINPNNKPRIFANTANITNNKSSFSKSIFTLCDYRKNDKCPPWSIQSSRMLHDNIKKTIYYDNALVKVYDIPVFYFPKLSHPDPTVKRRSGFLPAAISSSKNLGPSVTVPYFFAVDKDKNFTLTSRLFSDENPLFLGEYHQALKNSNFYADFGYTKGYEKTSVTKKSGEKSHFFSKIVKNFKGTNNSENTFDISLQDVSNDKYLKLYKIESNLVDYNNDTLKNSIDFTHSNEDLFFGINATAFETLKESYNDKYEYIFPEIFLSKGLIKNNLGNLDLKTNFKVNNYDTNKITKFLVNDFIWNSKKIFFDTGLFSSKILGNVKNINYEASNIDIYKSDLTNELHGALGLMSELNLQKDINKSIHSLTPKLLFRYAPGGMRKEQEENREYAGSRLDPVRAFSMNKVNNINNFEKGTSSTIGFDYKIKGKDKEFDFSVAQVISKKENKKMSSESSLDEKLSDLVASANYRLNDNISLNYDFAVDQNYSELNYNDLGLTYNFSNLNIDLNYLEEDKHIGNQEYLKTKIDFSANKNSLLSFETKRNLIKNSADFYNLSYEYINDCLRAGLVYRREFYNDSEIEPENSLMFKITLTPFGNIDSPTFSK
jgi:LPS-assembly protein